MAFFKNFIIIILIIGIISRGLNYLFIKLLPLKKKWIFALTIFCNIIIFCPIFAVYVGYDVIISEYLPAIILWGIYDYIKNKR